jgi:ketosteroid isomerase-like protein
MTRDEARAFADEWAAAWNDRAVERVLSRFDDDVSFTSPTALARIGSLRFAVDRVSWDPLSRELAIIYVSDTGRKMRVSENLVFGANGLVVSAEVFHGVEL